MCIDTLVRSFGIEECLKIRSGKAVAPMATE